MVDGEGRNRAPLRFPERAGMTAVGTPPSEALQALVPTLDLVAVQFNEISAVRAANFDPGLVVEQVTPSYSLKLGSATDLFHVTLRVEIATVIGHVTVESVASYQSDADGESNIGQDLALEFANHVGLMALLPFVREAVASQTLRVFGQPILMPMLQRGDLWFNPGDQAGPDEELGNP